MNYYINEIEVLQAIEYFKGFIINESDMFFLFLLAKHRGITSRNSITFLSSRLSPDEKEDCYNSLWMLGGMQGPKEYVDKRSIIFPGEFINQIIESKNYYQPGTTYSNIVPRIKDTIQKSNQAAADIGIYLDNSNSLTLKRNYSEIIESNYLNNQKISLKHLAAWMYRFIPFEFPDNQQITDSDFTRVLTKTVKNFFRISKKDFLWLFQDDLSFNTLLLSTQHINPKDIRAKFTFKDGNAPEINGIVSEQQESLQSYMIQKSAVMEYQKLSGENPTIDLIEKSLLLKKQIVLTGIPGVGKSRFLSELREKFDHSEMIQFHSNYSYEEFIGGETLTAGSVTTVPGIFLQFVQKAINNQKQSYLFIIDELNRGNIAQIFGETILLLDRGYTAILSKPIDKIKELTLPENLFIAGSMNISDRNIAFLDLAIRRRFGFIEISPNYELLSVVVKYRDYDLGGVLNDLNNEILKTLGKTELLLGHSYFLSNQILDNTWTDEQMKIQFNYVILPTLKEYTFSNKNVLVTILGDELCEPILDTDNFVEAFNRRFGSEG